MKWSEAERRSQSAEVMMMSDEDSDVVEVKPIAGIGTNVFGKWDASEVTCLSLIHI